MLFSAGLGLLAGLAGIWLIASNPGTRFSLALLEHFTGIQTRGVTGSFAQHLHIQHVALHNKQLDLLADDVDLHWQPVKLLSNQIIVNQLQIGNLELTLTSGDDQPATLPRSLQLPADIRLLQIDRLEVAQLQLNAPNAEQVQHFSALRAGLAINQSSYVLQLDGTTPWGNAAVQGNLATTAPFAIQGKVHWQGLPIKQGAATLPETSLSADVTGNLSRLYLQARLNTDQTKTGADIATGKIEAVLTPFATLPVDTLQFDLLSVNPASFYNGAPRAKLDLQADFKVHGNAGAPVLSGRFSVSNKNPSPWNSGGVPVARVSADLILSEHQFSWKDSRIDLGQGGVATGSGSLNLYPGTSQKPVALPELNAQFDLKQVDLLHIDSRLKRTHLDGSVKISNKDHALELNAKLQETNSSLNAQLRTAMRLDPTLKLTLQQLELKTREAVFAAQGSITLDKKQVFSVHIDTLNFNPARWLDVPEGRIAASMNLAGQLPHGQNWQIDAQVPVLNGIFAGMALHGESDFQIRQGEALAIRKLQLNWGSNHLSASGTWQAGALFNPDRHEHLQFSVAVPDLAALSRPFEKILPLSLQGAVYADGVLSGNLAQPSGRLSVTANQIVVPGRIYLDHLQADVKLADGAQGEFAGRLEMSQLSATNPENNQVGQERWHVPNLHAELAGLRHAHTLHLSATLPRNQQFLLEANGDWSQPAPGSGPVGNWRGQISALNLSGPLEFILFAPFNLVVSSVAAHMSEARWQGNLGNLHVEQMDWDNGQVVTRGQFQEIALVRLLKFWRDDLPVSGNLQLDAGWQLQIGPRMSGQIQISRHSGDLLLHDLVAGSGQPQGLGLQKLDLNASLGDSDRSAGAQIVLHGQVLGDQLGEIDADISSYLKKTDQKWLLAKDAPLSGQASMQIRDIRWLSQLLWQSQGINLHGAVDAHADVNGSLNKPDYHATVSAHGLQIAVTELGVLLPNGKLEAVVDGDQLTLNSLTFSESIKAPPRHENLNDLHWENQTGKIDAQGSVNLRTGQGSISAKWQKFPFMQNPNGWLVASGQAQLAEEGKSWNLTGQLTADAAYFSVPKQAAPKLSGDVVVLKKNAQRNVEKTTGLQSSLDFSISTGNNFIFVGRGLDTRLDGEMRIRSKNGGPITASGSIQTAGGTYEGYGQKLEIERGILNFQGPVDNPGLNVRAMRRGLAVEAGVEVVGTVARPEVHLISEPNVPDPDKLSWMVLGRGSDQMAGSEATLLMSAAGAIFGGEDGSKIPSTISRRFGLEGLSFGTTSTAPGSQLPAQTVAGTINSTLPGDQVFSVGKRITPNLVFSIERSLTDASNGMKLTWQLTRGFSIIGRAGSDNAIDGQYIFSFD